MSGADRAVTSTADGSHVDLAALVALRAQAGRLSLVPHGKVLATRSGAHLSRFRGRGMEYDESRVYMPGDDPRNMDWRVTARSAQPHVKLFREERERPVWLLVDQCRGMRFGTRVAFKSVVAARAAALLAWAGADQGDRVGGLVFDETRRFERPPAARTRAVLPMLGALAEFSGATVESSADGDAWTGPDASTTFALAADRLARWVRPGSLVFLISDFAGVGEGGGAWLSRLASGSEVVFVHVYDVLEESPPVAGRYPVTDGVRTATLDTGEMPLRTRWTRRFVERQQRIAALCRRHHAHLIQLRTDQPVAGTLALGLQPPRRAAGLGR